MGSQPGIRSILLLMLEGLSLSHVQKCPISLRKLLKEWGLPKGRVIWPRPPCLENTVLSGRIANLMC